MHICILHYMYIYDCVCVHVYGFIYLPIHLLLHEIVRAFVCVQLSDMHLCSNHGDHFLITFVLFVL